MLDTTTATTATKRITDNERRWFLVDI